MENSKMSVDDFGLGEYFHFLKFTTPSDIANCFYMGAVIGNADDEQANNFYELGLCIGMLMQIKDDFIDFSNQNLANKEIFLDVRNNQKRIPVILASRLAVNSERNFVRSVLGKTNLRQDEVRALREIALSDEVMDEARRVTLDIQQNALHLLEKINISREEFRLIILDILNNVRL
jgi:geranylgeranyl diphosphate synthase type II